MTPAQKAALLEEFASYRTGCDELFEGVLREAAAHFRSLIPDANGLLPCPMCGPGTPIEEGVTIEKQWNRYEVLVTPERRRVARIAFFAGYATALNDEGRHEEAWSVMDALHGGLGAAVVESPGRSGA